jgi:hypothetical protein
MMGNRGLGTRYAGGFDRKLCRNRTILDTYVTAATANTSTAATATRRP